MVKQIEETFGVDTSINVNSQEKNLLLPISTGTDENAKTEEATSFDIILEKMPSEDQKSQRLTVFRIIREITALGLKESKELTNSLPKALKESVSKEEADKTKQQLEDAGAIVKIQ